MYSDKQIHVDMETIVSFAIIIFKAKSVYMFIYR